MLNQIKIDRNCQTNIRLLVHAYGPCTSKKRTARKVELEVSTSCVGSWAPSTIGHYDDARRVALYKAHATLRWQRTQAVRQLVASDTRTKNKQQTNKCA